MMKVRHFPQHFSFRQWSRKVVENTKTSLAVARFKRNLEQFRE
jgi:hypothetical protein